MSSCSLCAHRPPKLFWLRSASNSRRSAPPAAPASTLVPWWTRSGFAVRFDDRDRWVCRRLAKGETAARRPSLGWAHAPRAVFVSQRAQSDLGARCDAACQDRQTACAQWHASAVVKPDPTYFPRIKTFARLQAHRRGACQMALGDDRVTFWFGCNMLRHAEMIRLSIRLMERVGYDVNAVGGPAYCCGTAHDHEPELQAPWRPAPSTVSTRAANDGRDKVITGALRATCICQHHGARQRRAFRHRSPERDPFGPRRPAGVRH